MIIMLFIGLNMLTMTLDHYQQTEIFTLILDYLNMIFICIFSTECLMKIFALRYHYFVEPWNLFDVVVVVLSILSTYDMIFISKRFADTQVRKDKIILTKLFYSFFSLFSYEKNKIQIQKLYHQKNQNKNKNLQQNSSKTHKHTPTKTQPNKSSSK
jgi:hypothetical protein